MADVDVGVARECMATFSPNVRADWIEDIQPFVCPDSLELERNYQHNSPNPPAFERFCLQRFFYLREYMVARRLDRCWCLDNDVLVFGDLADVPDSLEAWQAGSWLVSLNGLTEFCGFISGLYRLANDDLNCWRMKALHGAHLCDMNISSVFHRWTMLPVCYDHNITQPSALDVDGKSVVHFAVYQDRKRLFARNQRLYTEMADGRLMRMQTLHCWGPYKKKMRALYESVANSGIANQEILC